MVGHEPGQRVVLDARPREALVRVGVVVEQRDPWAQQHAVDAGLVLGREDAVDVDELRDGGADLLAAQLHHLLARVVSVDPRAPGLRRR